MQLTHEHTSAPRKTTGLLKMNVGVLTTCYTQYTWDRSLCIFLFNRTTLQVFVTYLTGALYMLLLWFYKHQHDNRVRSKVSVACQRWWFQWPFGVILVNCAPSGEMHNYCTPHIIKENSENWFINRCNYILLSHVYCVWQVVKTPTIILNNPVSLEIGFLPSGISTNSLNAILMALMRVTCSAQLTHFIVITLIIVSNKTGIVRVT